MHGCRMSLGGCRKVKLQLAWIKKKSKTRFMRKVDVVRVRQRACRFKIALQTCVPCFTLLHFIQGAGIVYVGVCGCMCDNGYR